MFAFYSNSLFRNFQNERRRQNYFSRKNAKKDFSSQRLLTPLLFQERPGEVIDMFAFYSNSLFRNFQDERRRQNYFSRKNAKKDFSSQRLLTPLLFQERQGEVIEADCIYSV
jgi:hypothetical protein